MVGGDDDVVGVDGVGEVVGVGLVVQSLTDHGVVKGAEDVVECEREEDGGSCVALGNSAVEVDRGGC